MHMPLYYTFYQLHVILISCGYLASAQARPTDSLDTGTNQAAASMSISHSSGSQKSSIARIGEDPQSTRPATDVRVSSNMSFSEPLQKFKPKRRHSEESRQRLSETRRMLFAMNPASHPRLGRKITEAHKEKIREANRKRVQSPEQREKHSIGSKAAWQRRRAAWAASSTEEGSTKPKEDPIVKKAASDQTKKKKLSEQHKKAIAAAMKKRPPFSDEHKAHLSASRRQYFAARGKTLSLGEKKQPSQSEHTASQANKRQRGRPDIDLNSLPRE